MLLETHWFFNIPLEISPLLLFVFFATFFEYNLHVIANRLTVLRPMESLKHLFSPSVSVTLRTCIIIGCICTVITFFMLDPLLMAGVVISGVITLSYSMPLIKRRGKLVRMREITYLKVFTVALGWTLITVMVPLLDYLHTISTEALTILFLRRFLFIYAITIPFEIRDMERERRFGNINLPMLYGVKVMKVVGIIILLLFCILSAVHEKYFLFDFAGRKTFFIPLMLSAIAAGWLIVFASDKKTNWYFKFWTDGTMILQFLLLLLFNQ
jgi:4-hydroxybenzoate polyprenyltransferase